MFQSFVKTAWRNLSRNKGYSALNIFGLAIGMACAGLIFLWVEDELDFDKVNTKRNHIYSVRETQKYDTYTATFRSTPALLGPAMEQEIPGIARTCRMSDNHNALVTVKDKPLYSSGCYAEASAFSMFTIPFIEGDAKTVFKNRYSLVITEYAAIKYFGSDKNVIGKSVRMDNQQDYVVTGLVKDFPANTTFRFEWMAPFEIWYDQNEWSHNWGNNGMNTFVEVKPNADVAAINAKLHGFIQQKMQSTNPSTAMPFLLGMNDWHLRNEFDNGVQTGGGAITYVKLFAVIAWIILLIACINFMNLATARNEKRAREVGVKKVLGADRKQLVIQFIAEAMFMAFCAAIASVIVMALVLPSFNLLVQKNLSLQLNNPWHIAAILATTLLCGIIAGSYPSLYLSSFRPVFVLKGIKLKDSSASFIRKGLVVMQFSVSVILIICTIVIYQQIQHVKARNLGFNKNHLLQADVKGELTAHYASVKQDLLNTGAFENIALSDYVPLYDGNNTGSLTWEGKDPNAHVLISGRNVSPGFFETTGMKLVAGRDFADADSAGNSKNRNIIITESLQKLMGNGSALGKVLWNTGDTSGVKLTVTGVINDYLYGNMYGKPDPVIFLCAAPTQNSLMFLRLKPTADLQKTLASVEQIFKAANPAFPFTYQFVDDEFNNLFGAETLVSQLSKLFAALAILISCLGLFGLAAFTAERRTKEIGVRKVLGASVAGVTRLLSKDFLQLVGISCLFAFPVAWWLMKNWLQDYQYRITISWWIFAAAGFTAIIISLLTISYQAIKAALANPVKSLRAE